MALADVGRQDQDTAPTISPRRLAGVLAAEAQDGEVAPTIVIGARSRCPGRIADGRASAVNCSGSHPRKGQNPAGRLILLTGSSPAQATEWFDRDDDEPHPTPRTAPPARLRRTPGRPAAAACSDPVDRHCGAHRADGRAGRARGPGGGRTVEPGPGRRAGTVSRLARRATPRRPRREFRRRLPGAPAGDVRVLPGRSRRAPSRSATRTIWAGILLAHVAVLLAPPLLSADVFGYVDFARLGVAPRPRPLYAYGQRRAPATRSTRTSAGTT